MLLKAQLYSGEILEYNIPLNNFTIGRSSKCNVVIPIEGVSRTHMMVELIHGDLYITDMESANGVMIDDEKIPPNKKIRYQTFFHLSFGPVKLLQIVFEQTSMIKFDSMPVTKQVREPVPQKKPQVFAKPIRTKKKSVLSKMVNVAAFAIIAAVLYYVYKSGHSKAGPADAKPASGTQVSDEYF